MNRTISKARWEKLRQRMIAYGIEDVPLKAIPLNIAAPARTTEEVAARLLILLAVAISASNADETDKIADWLKTEDIWQKASDQEKVFLRDHGFSDEDKASLSYRFEGAYMLAWMLKRVKIFPDPSAETDPELVADFFLNIPPLLSEADELFDNAAFRRMSDIHDEYLFYSMVKLYFANIRELDKENSSNVHEQAAMQRLAVLEWALVEGKEWDEEENE